MTNAFFPPDGYVFDICTPVQKEYIRKIHIDGTEDALKWLATVKNGECSYPQELSLTWPEGTPPYRVELSQQPDFTDCLSYTAHSNTLSLTNLKAETTYYWRIRGGEPHTFQTTGSCPRFIRLDGALNVRDLGGNRIRQGLIFRGSAIDGPFVLTEAGQQVFRDDLHIKTQIELRKGNEPEKTQSIAVGVHRIYAPYRPYMEVFEEAHKVGICKIMEIFADRSRYPIYFGCMGGADRTGMIALFLRAIAGESDDSIHTDYELTALSTYAAGAAEGADGFRSRNKPYYRKFLDELQTYAPGQPLSSCAVAFLLHCGVTQQQIDQIAAIIQM